MKTLSCLASSVLFVSLFFSVSAFGMFSSSDAGTRGASFLKFASGARSAAMAGAFSAVPNGGSDAVYWNPASLSSIVRKEASFMYSSYFEDIAYGWASFALPSSYYGIFGAGLQYLSYGEFDETDGSGNPYSEDISPYDMALYLSYANSVEFSGYGILNYGFSFKYVYSKIEDSASAIALDGGILFALRDKLTSFAFVFQNFGTGLQYDQTSESLPFALKIAVSRILFEKLIVDFDLNLPSDNSLFPALGAEYMLSVNQDADLFVRAGYTGRDKDLPGFAGFNAGFGIRFADYSFDYAFSPYGDFGSAHRLSAGVKFGETVSKQKRAAKKKTKRVKPAKPAPAPVKADIKPKRAEKSPAKQNLKDENIPESRVFEGEYSGGYNEEEDAPVKEVAKNAGTAVVLEFSSQQVNKNERGVYTEMLRSVISGSGRFKVLSKQAAGGVYFKNSIPSKDDLTRIFKQTGAETIFAGNIEKTGKTLEFKLYVYDEDLNEKEFSFSSENSFRAVKSNMQEKAGKF